MSSTEYLIKGRNSIWTSATNEFPLSGLLVYTQSLKNMENFQLSRLSDQAEIVKKLLLILLVFFGFLISTHFSI